MARLILPGWHGSGPSHWQRLWLADDPTARIVEQDDWDNPDRGRWIARLQEAISADHAPVTLIAHSLGTALVAHYAAAYPDAPIRAALLVAPGDADIHAKDDARIASFAPVPRGRLPFPSILVVSSNDVLMDHGRAVQLGQDWGSRIVEQGDAGHINADSGYGRWPAAYDLADEIEQAAA